MRRNIRMLIDNRWDEATLSVETGTAISVLPVEHSQQYGRSKTVGITPDANHTSSIVFTLPELTILDGLVMYRHWLSNVAKWRLELFDGESATGNLIYDSAEMDCVQTKLLGELDWLVDPLVGSTFDDWPHKFSQHWFEGVFVRSGRLTLIDAESRDGIHEFDRIYLGTTIQPRVNFNYGHSHLWDNTETQITTAAGSVFAARKEPFRRFNFDLDWISDTERPHFSEANRKVGLSRDWFISMMPEAGGQRELDYAMACRYSTVPSITGRYYNTNSIPISVREA